MTAKRIVLWSLASIAGLLLVVCGVVLWTLNSHAGARWAVSLASKFTHQALQVRRVEGTIAGPLTLHDLSFADEKSGTQAKVGLVEVNVSLHELLHMRLHVSNANVRDVQVKLGEKHEEDKEPSKPFSLDPPLDILVDRFTVTAAAVNRNDAPVVTIDSAIVAANWTHQGLTVKQLDVQSPQGQVHFAGSVANAKNYAGQGRGHFQWTVGERKYAGALTLNSRNGSVDSNVDLTAPVPLKLNASVRQQESLPWTLELNVPAFDPRKELMPSSSLTNLAGRLRGSGTRTQGSVNGTVMVDAQTIDFEQLSFQQREQDLGLNAKVKFGSGTIDAIGTVFTQHDPLTADMNVSWRDLEIPEQLAGQLLHTAGQLEFHGGAEAYRASGALQIGPPRKLADIQLNLEGTPERVQLHTFKVNQRNGFATLAGVIDLKPNLAWDVQAQTHHFDPGAFAVAWKGDLNMQLTSQGRLKEAGPTATLKLTELSGRLRNRPLNGTADLSLSEKKVLAGNLNVASGRSRVRIDATPGDVMNAVANIDIPGLDDWLPNAGGELRSRINAKGRWPDMSFTGTATGKTLHLAVSRVDDFDLTFALDRPTDPQGKIALDAHGLAASGLEFSALSFNANGDAQQHRIELHATGQPLSTELVVEGGKQTRDGLVGWNGSVQKAVFDIKNAARLVLQDPARVNYLGKAINVSQSCFADGAIRLCAAVDVAQDGAMHGDYLLRNVPLSLANAFVPASLAMTFEGTLDGDGNMQRDAKGTVNGKARIESRAGRILRQFEATADQPQPLLTYADLNLDAQLNGTNAQARIHSTLNDSGSLQGAAQLQGLGTAAPNVDGNLQMHLPSISIIELFAPQLANVKGRADVDIRVRGETDGPELSGQLNASQLAMDVPVAGLKLRDGHVSVTPRGTSEFVLDGAMKSGDGEIALTGTALSTGIVNVQLQGKKFLAADIPSAHVVINPDLKVTRTAENINVAGTVNVPSATINLQKLPRNRSTQSASSDVVVIDAKTQEEAQSQSAPIYASINVSLGDDVNLTGFGLEAKVAGQLDVIERPGNPTSGSGSINVEGRYKAYGQDLTIQQGQLLFAGTPLDNPRLNIVAVRVVEDVTAGLKITGEAKNPQLTVFSDPPMGQSNALAYLVTGKPLSEVGNGSGDGDALQTAARSLETAAGGLLAKNIGKRLGLDEVGVKDSEAIGGAALTVGQYLSPRLYLSYGVGLFEPGEVITLRYKLSKAIALEALNGPKDSRAGVEYRIER
jgi:translocation and assembly module TamB